MTRRVLSTTEITAACARADVLGAWMAERDALTAALSEATSRAVIAEHRLAQS